MTVTLHGRLSDGNEAHMEFDDERTDGGMALLEWLLSKGDGNSDAGWQRMNEWRRENGMEALL